MSEYFPPESGLELHKMPSLCKETTLEDVFKYFQNELAGKTLTRHLAAGGTEDIVTQSTIYNATIFEDGTVSFLSEDGLGQPTFLQFDGKSTKFTWSIYEANDFWFQDEHDDRIWYGIYDTGLSPGYVRLKEV